jgi:hypothetical protein
MPITMLGIVYYADDPEKKVFRIVYPSLDDKELDEPPTDSQGIVMRDERGQPHSWTTLGIEPGRTAVLEKVLLTAPRDWAVGYI